MLNVFLLIIFFYGLYIKDVIGVKFCFGFRDYDYELDKNFS